MVQRRSISWPLRVAVLAFLSAAGSTAFAQNCGQFTDVPASSVFCPFILQAFISSITQGTSPTTFSPSDLVPREQMVTFFDRGMDLTLHRGTVRTAIGKTWFPTSTNGVVVTDVGGPVTDIVSDGHYLWIARNDGKVLKVEAADRRVLETWSMPSGAPRKLGVFGGLVFIADNAGGMQVFNPTNPVGTATTLFNAGTIASGFSNLSFDGKNVWLSSSSGPNVLVYPAGNPSGIIFTAPANVQSTVFDGTFMWVLLANQTIQKLSPPASTGAAPTLVETLNMPGQVTDCRMLYDGTNIWIPSGFGTLFVVRPTTSLASLPSSIAKNEAIPDVAFPYVAAFDGENVVIGGVNNGTVAIYKATTLARIRTVVTGAGSIRGIANDGINFSLGDATGTKFFQF